MTDSPRMEFELVARTELTLFQRDAMFELLTRHFAGVTREQFEHDLAEKHLALLLRQAGRLTGFSTLLAYSCRFEQQRINVIYSGDTIVAPEAWGTMVLPRAWVAGVQRLQSSLPPGRCYWLLLSSGFRTYRFLSVFWREFFPHYSQPTPVLMQRLLDDLAQSRFGNQYDTHRGLVCFRHPQRLRPGLAEVPTGRERNPHTDFFLSRNPGYSKGDELVCLTELCPENLTAAGRRMMPNYELADDHR